jgi:hypothetical protein
MLSELEEAWLFMAGATTTVGEVVVDIAILLVFRLLVFCFKASQQQERETGLTLRLESLSNLLEEERQQRMKQSTVAA